MASTYSYAAGTVAPQMPAIKCGMPEFLADADRAGLASHTSIADIDIVIARGEIEAGLAPNAMLLLPVVLKSAHNRWPCCRSRLCCKSASAPVAVLLLPVVLLKSATKPVAVLCIAGVLCKERIITGGCVCVAGRVV